jgi:hypothetical protein
MIDPFGPQFHHPMENVLSLQSLGEQPATSLAATVGCTSTGICGDTWSCGSTGWCGATSACGSTRICSSESQQVSAS